MREPTLRPSPSAPPSTGPSKPAEPGRAADWTPVDATLTDLPIAPTEVPLPEIHRAHPIDASVSLHELRPTPELKGVWNKHAGRADARPDNKSPYDTVAPYDESLP